MDIAERADWLHETLDARGIPSYGRASIISRNMQCAKAASTGWLKGTLPRDMRLGFRFADQYGFDVREWVMGTKQEANEANWSRAINTARAFEKTVASLSDDQFMMIVKLAMAEEADQLSELLNQLGNILRTG